MENYFSKKIIFTPMEENDFRFEKIESGFFFLTL